MATINFKREITNRFNQIVNYLKINKIVKNNTDIANLINQPLQVVSKLISGERIITLEQTAELSKRTIINTNWLLTGKGNMLKQDKVSPEVNLSIDDMIGDAISKKIGELTRDYDEKIENIERDYTEKLKELEDKFNKEAESTKRKFKRTTEIGIETMQLISETEKYIMDEVNLIRNDSNKATG